MKKEREQSYALTKSIHAAPKPYYNTSGRSKKPIYSSALDRKNESNSISYYSGHKSTKSSPNYNFINNIGDYGYKSDAEISYTGGYNNKQSKNVHH